MRRHFTRKRHRLAGTAAALLLMTAACGDDSDDGDGGEREDDGTTEAREDGENEGGSGAGAPAPLPDEYDSYSSDLYSDTASWLCFPDEDDVCARDLDATVVNADGTVEVEAHEPAEDPAVDCFYVYPTTSSDETPNSDMEPAEGEEIFTAWNQTARLTESCRVFAPVYRQVTLSMIGGGGQDTGDVDPRAVAYDDVVDAFRHYIANESDGRGFVLVGHSQGAGHLTRLMADEIDGEPALRDRLVGSYILGSSVAVPEGEVVGGDLREIPLCEQAGQTGCVVTYASFRDTAPPPEDSLFGRPREGDGVAGCVNPGAIEGGPAELTGYTMVDPVEGSLGPGERFTGFADGAEGAPEIDTAFVSLPGLVTAECVSDGGFSYLSLTVNGDPDDPRVDDIPGDLTPEWGMHLVDVSVAMGDISTNIRAQADTYGG